MKKKVISFVLIIAMLAMFVPSGWGVTTAFASNDDFVIEDGILTEYNGSGGDVTIPNGVTEIGEYAFSYCDSLKSITIPNSVTKVGSFAFTSCSELTSITIPNSVTEIGDGAFQACSNLTSITLPNSISSIGYRTFEECGITSIIIPNSVIEIGDYAFSDCSDLTSITLPNSITSIGMQAFFYCSNLTNIMIPNAVSKIGEFAFSGCSNLVSINVSEDNSYFTSIEGALYNKEKRRLIAYPNGRSGSVTIPSSVENIGDFAFYNCNRLTSIIIPNSVTSINSGAFSHCGNLTNIMIPKFVASIESQVFEYCGSLTSITIPDSVTTIDYRAFFGCSNLTSIMIPHSVTLIGWSAFYECQALEDIYYAGTQQQWNSMLIDDHGDEIDLGLNDNVTIHFNYVSNPLSIISHPANVTAKVNDSVSFSVKAQGEGLTYQWYYKKAGQTTWNKWGARTTATTTATANATWNGMQVYCKITDKFGNTVDSNPATITIKQDLKITAQPTDKMIKLGESLTLSVKAEGIGLTYQWYYKKSGTTAWSKWNGRTHGSETVTPNTTWNGIQLYCVVKDSSGKKVQSNTIKVLFSDVVTIVTQPKNVTAKTGENVTFKFVAEGVGLTYQWYYKKAGATAWSKWNGRTTASTTATSNASWDGMQVYCVVKNSSGSTLNSNTAKITLSDVLAITQQPSNVTTQAGQNVIFTVKAKGVGLKYQWQYKKSGQTSWNNWGARTTASTTATSNATWQGMQVRCIVTDSAGNKITSNPATITINLNP